MKKALFLFMVLIVSNQGMLAKVAATPECRLPRIGSMAPSFEGKSTKGDIKFPADYRGKWVVLFSHPADFTPVCKTEFKRLAGLQKKLEAMNTQLLGLSVDSKFTHEIFIRNIEAELKEEGKARRTITFPVIADQDKKIAQKYGMIHPNESAQQTVRSVFIIDPKGKVRMIFYYPLAIGRGFNEIVRAIQALQISDAKGVATPADWQPGKPTISKKQTLKDILPNN